MAVLPETAKHGPTWTPPMSTGTAFTDVPISHWTGDFIEQLYAEGITGGCGGGPAADGLDVAAAKAGTSSLTGSGTRRSVH